MAGRNKLVLSLALTVALVAANLVALNALLAPWSTARVDLTEEGLYSISPATKRLLVSLEEDAVIYGYFSRRTHPKLAPLVPAIEDLLDEYRSISGGRVKVQFIDPAEDEEAAQDASDRFGVESTPFRLASKYESGIVNAYFALVVKYGDQYVRYGFDDLIEIEPLPDGDIDVRLRNLEYDLTRAIKKVVYGFRGAAELFERVEGSVRLTAVMTPETLPDVIAGVPEAVRKAAAELAEKGGDKFEYEEIDPSASEEAQLQVLQRFGAGPMTLGLFGDEQFFLYGFLEVGGRVEQLPLTVEGISAAGIREAVEDTLRRQTPGFLKTVGLVTPAPAIPPEVLMQLQMQGRTPPTPPPEFEQVKRLLQRDYEVQDVRLDSARGVPTDVDVLVVLKPKDLDERAVYNLDQYLMRGGRLIVCTENFEADFNAQSGLRVTPLESGLADWLAHFGIDIPRTLVLDDRNQPLPIPEMRMTSLGMLRTWRMEPYPYLVEVRDDGLVNREIVPADGAVGIYWGSPIEVDRERAGELEVIEILRSSPRSWTSDDLTRVALLDYEVPEEGIEARLLAVALSGKFPSYFAGKQPPQADGAADADVDPDGTPGAAEVPLEQSPETRLIVVGDAAFLSDFVARALGRLEGGFFGENLAFMQNLIDWANLDNDMIDIRSRGVAARRLERLDRGREIAIEAASYLLVIAALALLGGHRVWRRRNTRPLIEAEPASAPAAARRAEG